MLTVTSLPFCCGPRSAYAYFISTSLPSSGLRRDLGWQWFMRLIHQVAPDEGAVLGKLPGDLRLADSVQVADAPIQLLQGVFGGLPVAFPLLRGHHSSLAVDLSTDALPPAPAGHAAVDVCSIAFRNA